MKRALLLLVLAGCGASAGVDAGAVTCVPPVMTDDAGLCATDADCDFGAIPFNCTGCSAPCGGDGCITQECYQGSCRIFRCLVPAQE